MIDILSEIEEQLAEATEQIDLIGEEQAQELIAEVAQLEASLKELSEFVLENVEELTNTNEQALELGEKAKLVVKSVLDATGAPSPFNNPNG